MSKKEIEIVNNKICLNELDEAEILIKKCIDNNPNMILCQKKLAEIYFLKNDLKSSAQVYENICREYADKASVQIFAALRGIQKKIFSDDEKKASWKRICNENDNLAERAYELLKNGKLLEAKNNFTLVINNNFEDVELRNIWKDSFNTISILFSEKKYEKQYIEYNKKVQQSLMVSGMGWSGSGALYDFFREFTNLVPVKGESRIITGSPGLKSLIDKAKYIDVCSLHNIMFVIRNIIINTTGPKSFIKNVYKSIRQISKGRSCNLMRLKKEIVSFFGLGLLGIGIYDSWAKWKIARYARMHSFSGNTVDYAKKVNLLLKYIVGQMNNSSFNMKNFESISPILIDAISTTNNKNNSILLFDNVIPMMYIDIIDFIGNTTVCCTVRDPRSNYVALIRENPAFKSDVESYIISYRRKRKKFEWKSKKLLNKNAVIIIPFEEFVMSENYRQSLAKKIGIDLSLQEKYSFFRPWESEKNVLLHETYENQDEIKLIERELQEYCIDVHKYRSKQNAD